MNFLNINNKTVKEDLEIYQDLLKENKNNAYNVLENLKDLSSAINKEERFKAVDLKTRYNDDIIELGAISQLMVEKDINYIEAELDLYQDKKIIM